MLAAGLTGVAAAAWLAWNWRPADGLPAPPVPELAAVEPGVTAMVNKAREAVLLAPRSADTWGTYGKVLRANGFNAESNICFAAAERLDPTDPRWPYLLGLGRLVLGPPDAAVADLRRALARVGDGEARTAVRLRLAEALLEQGQTGEAESIFAAETPAEPARSRAHLGLAMVAAERGDWDTAAKEARTCLASPFTRQKAAVLLASASKHRGDAAGAAEAGALAARAPVDVPWVDAYVGEVNRLSAGRQSRLAEAERLEQQGRRADAARLLEEIVRESPDAHTLTALGATNTWLGRFGAAQEALRAALRLEPDRVQAHYTLGLSLHLEAAALDGESARSKRTEAAAEAEKAIALKPDHAPAHFVAGLCLQKLGKLPEAIAHFRAGIACRPEVLDGHLYLAEALAEAGRKDEAFAVLEAARPLAGNDERLNAAVAKLGGK
jgi:tetratricopeptide (TPR) repeat protein